MIGKYRCPHRRTPAQHCSADFEVVELARSHRTRLCDPQVILTCNSTCLLVFQPYSYDLAFLVGLTRSLVTSTYTIPDHLILATQRARGPSKYPKDL